MGVYVKKMKMPKDCIHCLLTYERPEDGEEACLFTDVECLSIGRQNDCPLIEVKTPHGRLYEETKIIDFAKDMKISASDYATWWYGEDAVIEAEVE